MRCADRQRADRSATGTRHPTFEETERKPRWILDRHPYHEISHLAWRYRPASTSAGAAVVLPGNQPPVPAENRVRRDDAGDLCQNPPAEFLASHRESTALGVGQAKWTWAKLLPEDPILLPEIIDHVFLVAVHPASGREYEEAQSVGHSLRLLGEQPLAPTLFRRFANLGRFVAPYGIRRFVRREPRERLTALLHHVTVDALRRAFFELKRDAADGADGMTWRMYEDGLEGRLADLHDRVHSGAYRAKPSRRVNIPKPDGGTRPRGVAAIEDKIVQKAVTETILTPIYEAELLGFSYGFQRGRGAHGALAAGLIRRKINWVVDCDIRAFFDTVSRDWMVRFLEHRIGDKRVIRLIIKWLNAGVMEAGQWRDNLRGTPQGSVVTPRTQKVTSRCWRQL